MNKKLLAIFFAILAAALYAIAPFIGTFLSFIIFQEELSLAYFIGLVVMILGTAIVVIDTLAKKHKHSHKHLITHTHDDSIHSHMIEHEHEHSHYLTDKKHQHRHKKIEIVK